jgi:hypothetical protein
MIFVSRSFEQGMHRTTWRPPVCCRSWDFSPSTKLKRGHDQEARQSSNVDIRLRNAAEQDEVGSWPDPDPDGRTSAAIRRPIGNQRTWPNNTTGAAIRPAAKQLFPITPGCPIVSHHPNGGQGAGAANRHPCLKGRGVAGQVRPITSVVPWLAADPFGSSWAVNGLFRARIRANQNWR